MTDYRGLYNEDYFNGKNSFFYSLGYARYSKIYFDNLYNPLKNYLRNHTDGRVLDVGCAYGLLLQRFPKSYQKFGIDVSEHAVQKARERNPDADIQQHSAEDAFLFPDNYFDIVICNDVLEHLEHPTKALENIRRVVKSTGLVYLNLPNLNWFRKTFYSGIDRKEHHISLCPHNGIARAIRNAGLVVIDCWTYTSLTYFFFVKFRSTWGLESAFFCTKPTQSPL